MAVGRRIRYFRLKNNMTQRQLGELLGFSQGTAEVRVNQYEHENRVPKEDTLKKLAEIFQVDTAVFRVPNIDSMDGLMQTFFALEDFFGAKITQADGEFSLRLNTKAAGPQKAFNDSVWQEWLDKQSALERGELTQAEYDAWRYHFTENSLEKHMAKMYGLDMKDWK